MYGAYGHGWMYEGGLGMALGGFWMLLVWLVPLLIIFLLIRHFVGGTRKDGTPLRETGKSAMDYLKDAYARGEIDRETFLRKKEDLANN